MPPEEDEKSILTEEIESWKGFEYALRKLNATLFNIMLKECLENEEYASASETRGPLNDSKQIQITYTTFQFLKNPQPP